MGRRRKMNDGTIAMNNSLSNEKVYLMALLASFAIFDVKPYSTIALSQQKCKDISGLVIC